MAAPLPLASPHPPIGCGCGVGRLSRQYRLLSGNTNKCLQVRVGRALKVTSIRTLNRNIPSDIPKYAFCSWHQACQKNTTEASRVSQVLSVIRTYRSPARFNRGRFLIWTSWQRPATHSGGPSSPSFCQVCLRASRRPLRSSAMTINAAHRPSARSERPCGSGSRLASTTSPDGLGLSGDPGQHTAIITKEFWDGLHQMLQRSPRERRAENRSTSEALLKGLIFSNSGSAMTPTYTRKGDRLYHY